jgi:chromosomal replication initiation ATPase DnaA
LWHHQSNNIVYDDAHKQFGSCEFEQELFHACNLAKENSTYLLVTIDKPIAQQSITLPDLSSRLAAAPQIAMHDPDDETLRYIMVKLLNDRQITVSPDVVQYILPRIERSFIAMQSLVKKLDDASLSEKRAITIPLVKSLIDA